MLFVYSVWSVYYSILSLVIVICTLYMGNCINLIIICSCYIIIIIIILMDIYGMGNMDDHVQLVCAY